MTTRLTRTILVFFLLLTVFLLPAQEEQVFDWSKAEELFPGIRHAFVKTDRPRPLRINVILVDLKRKDLRFMTVKRDPDWGMPMPDYPSMPIRVRRLTVWKFMDNALARGIDMLVAVNATPWGPWKPPYTHSYAAKMGLVISDGDKIESANGRPVFLITRKNEFQIRKIAKDEDTSDIQLALSGFIMILENGQVLKGPHKLAPRTAYGLSKDATKMLIMTVDGRMKGYSEGVSTPELGEWMRKFGAYNALNMDGGGSTTLLVSDGKGGIRQLTAKLFYRTVATSLGIFRVKEDGKKKPPEKIPAAQTR